MGIVIRQSFWSSIFIFLGVILGAVNVLLLFDRTVGAEIFGLTRVIFSLSFIAAEFAVLGSPTVLIKYFPYFRDERKKGIVLFSLLLALVGLIITIAVLYFAKDLIISSKTGDAELFNQYYFVAIIGLFGVTLYKFFQAYFKTLYLTIFPVFLNDFMLRLYTTLWLCSYVVFDIELYHWMLGYGLIYLINPVIMVIYLLINNKLDLSWNKKIDRKLSRSAIVFGLWNLLAGASSSLVSNVDIIMLWQFLLDAEERIALYAKALYITALIVIPVRAIDNITQPLIAQMFKDKNNKGLARLYSQSSINQLIVSGLVFILIWINVDTIFLILNDNPEEVKWVVLFIGISKVFSVATGVNGVLINHSKHYRFTTYFIIVLALFTILFNRILIPQFELIGAALATSFALFMFNFIKWLFVWLRMKMQPFSLNSLKVVFTAIVVILVSAIVPYSYGEELIPRLLDIAIRSILAASVFVFVILKFGLSDELSSIFQSFKKRIGNG